MNSYKKLGLILLTLQQASMPLMARASRDRQKDKVFITTVNVFSMELIKLTTCTLILTIQERSFKRFLVQCKRTIIDDIGETWKVCVPALIYTVQNNLYYIALSNLEATTFCLTYQLKTFSTAILLRVMLKKRLSGVQWFALFLLAVGVSDVQLQYQPPKTVHNTEQSPTVGFLAVLTMCLTSAFAGVYLEKVLKQSDVNIWMQNIRLAVLGIPISALSMLKNYDSIMDDGMFRGFDCLVWIMTITNSIGGLLISIVIKYADNILKAFAQGFGDGSQKANKPIKVK
ncbi:unnamed protein product [Enterobius vermicularis]|uniref:Nucleotide-sugar transporter family protein n=1 Tax=Enterobius vermicularis TaxID=51028 RepID=A0A158QB78_ENTVE|nr:unnamed protein product [Enterobius vermicularis]